MLNIIIAFVILVTVITLLFVAGAGQSKTPEEWEQDDMEQIEYIRMCNLRKVRTTA